MPYVYVKSTRGAISPINKKEISKSIPEIVARELNVAEGQLMPRDVDVFFSKFEDGDIHSRDIQVIIQANFYEERNKNLDKKAQLIARDIHESTSSGLSNMSVWIQLVYGGYFETIRSGVV